MTQAVDTPPIKQDIYLIDGAAPFFYPFINGRRKNWSKAPLSQLQCDGILLGHHLEEICTQTERYCRKVREIGYNAISFDDLAHLTSYNFYPSDLRRTVKAYQDFFRRIFAIAQDSSLRIYITSDLTFLNEHIEAQCSKSNRDKILCDLFREAVANLFENFPEVAGIVTRIGEADGHDVDSLFKTRMQIKTPRQCNRWLNSLLPIFEKQQKLLIFRTWGLGAFPVGDLIWNKKTEKRAFHKIDSSAFIVSRKYGPSDFFRFVELNERVIHSRHQQIVELQARREYEGFGVFPAYIGRQYQGLRDQLRDCPTLRGISVWCQTGGWSHFDQLTFLDNSSLWNEMNTIATFELFSTEKSAKEVLKGFCQQSYPQAADQLQEVIELFDQLIDQLWYFVPFANRTIWFRRLRVPPLLWIFWDTIIVNRALRLMFHVYLEDPAEIHRVDRQQRKLLKQLRQKISELPEQHPELELGVDTFRMLYTLRRFYSGNAGKKREKKIAARLKKYYAKHPAGFQVECDFSPFHIRWVTAGVLFSIIMRERASYRKLDRFALIPLTCWLFPLVKRWHKKRIPELAERQALGLELFFR